jgi:hypothetical protein
MVAIRSSETSAYTRSTRRHIPEDGILHNHRRENRKSYIENLFVLESVELLYKIWTDMFQNSSKYDILVTGSDYYRYHIE